eukprot:COSAG05_NODE_3866_length_1798_cov_3.230135_2_plen_45_part_01
MSYRTISYAREVQGFSIGKYFSAHLSPCTPAEAAAFKAELAAATG